MRSWFAGARRTAAAVRGPGALSKSLHPADAIAALAIAGLLVPEAVAYSGLAGLPPQAGVLALFAGLLCYGLIGTSRYAIVSATSSSAAVLAAATSTLGAVTPAQRLQLAALLVIVTGAVFLVAGCARLGVVSNLIARPVLRGYAFGLALVIALKQWPLLVGINAGSGDFLPLLIELIRRPGAWNLISLAVGVTALMLLLLLERRRYLPAALVVIVGGIAASPWLSARGVALTGPVHLAPAAARFAVPVAQQWRALIEYAIAIMFILFAESWSSIRTYAFKHGDDVRPNRDLLALGVSNVLSGLLHGTAVGAGYSATSANETAGARSRWAGLYAAAVVLLLVVLFLPWIERIPQPILAAVVIHAVSKSLRVAQFRPYMRWHRDVSVALIALVGVLVLGIMNGLLIAIAFSLLLLLRGLASPRLSILGRLGVHDYVSRTRFPQATLMAGVLIVRPEEPLFFLNAEPLMTLVRQAVQQYTDTRLLVLSLEESPDLDSTSIESLGELADWLAARGTELRLARLKDAAYEVLARARLPHLAASALEYSSVDDAVHGQA